MFFIIKVYDIVYGGVIAEFHYQNKENAKKKFYEALIKFNNEINNEPEDYGFDSWESFNDSCWEDKELEEVVKCLEATFDD